jgi:hypothetical protein
MINRAVKRDMLRQDWFAALENGRATVMMEEVQAPPERVPGILFLRGTRRAIAGVSAFTAALAGAAVVASMTPFGYPLVFLALGYGLPRMPRWVPTLWRVSRMGIDAATLHQIGRTVLQSLLDSGILKMKKGVLQVKTHSDDSGTLQCALSGGTAFEKSLFLDALEELIRPVENPRYLIAWKRAMWKGLAYNAVPKLLGQKKEYAEHFLSLWQRNVGARNSFIHAPLKAENTWSKQGLAKCRKKRPAKMWLEPRNGHRHLHLLKQAFIFPDNCWHFGEYKTVSAPSLHQQITP